LNQYPGAAEIRKDYSRSAIFPQGIMHKKPRKTPIFQMRSGFARDRYPRAS